MGSSNSCLPVKLSAFHRSRRRSTTRKRKLEREEAICINAMNVNRASVDELLLLPGITRSLALNIVHYRNAHQGFRYRSEILKVDGITSRIFRRICEDITVTSPLSNKASVNILPDLNSASYTELCSVPGLTPKLAAEIIRHREREGPFRSIDELLRVKDVDDSLFAMVRPYVSINPQQSFDCETPHYATPYAADALSLASLLLDTLPAELQAKLVASPLSPRLSSIRSSENGGKQKLFRFASWNLQHLTKDKAQNPGVREVICRTILANNFALIGIQEIGSKESLDLIVKELNDPNIPSIRHQSDRSRGKWRYAISDVAGPMCQNASEHFGFLYDASTGIELQQASSLSSQAHFTRSPYVTIFRLQKKLEFVFVNIHLGAKSSDEKDEARALSVLTQAMKNTIEQQHVVIFGTFNISPTAEDFRALMPCNYSPTIAENTDISLPSADGTACLDNIWLSDEAKTLSTGNVGVVRGGLTSLWIPAGWNWGGLVSNHCPIWTEFNLP